MAAHRFLPALAVLSCACTTHPPEPPRQPDVVVRYASPMWYEETGTCFQLTPDGRRVIFGTGPRSRAYTLPDGKEDSSAWRDSMPQVPAGAPPKAIPRWSPDGSTLAYFVLGGSTVTIGAESAKTIHLDGAVNGLSWAPAGDALYSIVLHPDGLSSLEKISLEGSLTTVRSNLDASPFFNTLAFSADGATVYLSLASESVPDVAQRHDPEAKDRDLDIYALDIRNNQLRLVMRSASGDDFCPQIAAGVLYWTHNEPGAQVVLFPIGGGEPHAVAEHGFLPRWSPDGRQIAFTRGYHRLADYGLDMDGWVLGIDASERVLAPAHEWITGFGEDMGPVWSPDGHWVAYHSHRSATAVPLYESPGRTDDIWLKQVSGGPEIRLTDFGFEVGPPDWAPDGRHLIFDSWDKDGVPRFAKPWIITIDPSTGQPLGSARMPLPAGVAGITGESWSPRGDEIAFVQRIDDTKRALWISRADGSAARKLVEFQSYTIGGVAWTPDGKQLLYGALTDDRMQIFAVSLQGGPPRQLTHDTANVMHPSVSPDGRAVAASRIPWRKELWRMTH
jgi:Tol biopolymer transport system component